MAVKNFRVDINLNENEIQGASFEKVAADIAGNVAGQFWQDTALGRVRVNDAGTVRSLAYVEDIATRMRFIGDADLSGGTVPLVAPADVDGSTNIDAGDIFVVSVDGILVPAPASGSATVTVGDLIISRVTNPTTNADFFTVEQNIDLSAPQVAVESIVVAPGDWAAAGGDFIATVVGVAVSGLISSVVPFNATSGSVETFEVQPGVGTAILRANAIPADTYNVLLTGLSV